MTNNKFKDKNIKLQSEASPLEDFIEAAKKEDLEGIIAALIAMDDEQFDAMSDTLYHNFDKIYNSTAWQNIIANKMSLLTDSNFEEEQKGYEGLNDLIAELDISDNKKKFLKYLFDHSYEAVLKYREDPSEKIDVTIEKLNPDAIIPTYAHIGDAGADLYSVEDHKILPGATALIHTGIALKVPKGYEAQVRPRSGLSLKTKSRVANSPGTIDSNYRGEICVIMDNISMTNDPIIIKKGDKIAQLVFNKVPIAIFTEGTVGIEKDNTRGDKGFGSTDNG